MRSRVDAARSGRTRLMGRWLGALVLPMILAAPAAASADVTLGTTTQPSNSVTGNCFGTVIGQLTSDPTTPYTVPAGGGEITAWQTNATGATPGSPLTLVVLRPLGSDSYSVVGTDSEDLPDPLPANNIASFTLATPIAVNGGDTLGLYSGASGETAPCFWDQGSTPSGDSLIALGTGSTPAAGQTLNEANPGAGGALSGPDFTLDLAATLVDQQDVGVTTTTPLASVSPGDDSLLASTVTNLGPASAPITFIDDIPSGLQIDSVLAGSGSCATSGQQVTCTISGLAPGGSTPVDIVVTPTAPGSYLNSVSVAPLAGITDPNPTNNNASAVLAVASPIAQAAPATAKCVVPGLKGIPGGFARRVLGLLGCTVRNVSKVHSRVAKGDVIKSLPGAGTYAAGKVVALQVSSGPKPTRKRTPAK